MKSVQASGWLAFGWLIFSMSATGQNSFNVINNSPPEITLNGIESIFDNKRALFKVRPADESGSESFFLAEGQHAGGIELLAVDMAAGKIKVNNHGVIQTIALCQPASLPALVASAGNLEMNFAGNAQMSGTETGGQYPGAGYIGGGANQSAAKNASQGHMTETSPDNAFNNDAASNGPQKAEPYSIKAAREFERLRLQTAAAVYAGTDEPIPLTPLTPPGTPLALIGPEKAWFPD